MGKCDRDNEPFGRIVPDDRFLAGRERDALCRLLQSLVLDPFPDAFFGVISAKRFYAATDKTLTVKRAEGDIFEGIFLKGFALDFIAFCTDQLKEIINILIVRRFVTARELSEELHVNIRTIQKDILALSRGFPIYTKQGGGGGIFIEEHYKPYINTLTAEEVERLKKMYRASTGVDKKVLYQVLRKYGPDKLEL